MDNKKIEQAYLDIQLLNQIGKEITSQLEMSKIIKIEAATPAI